MLFWGFLIGLPAWIGFCIYSAITAQGTWDLIAWSIGAAVYFWYWLYYSPKLGRLAWRQSTRGGSRER